MDPGYLPSSPIAGKPGDLYIIMADHGWTYQGDYDEGVLFFNNEQILSSELDLA